MLFINELINTENRRWALGRSSAGGFGIETAFIPWPGNTIVREVGP